ncbi:type II toxin-antitoxin system VapC family toxin [Neorhizobium alkalisoli]|uniref:type II toxin-antitoxin system VapC family toxin n=1 Tax=Neorhizobium alkalisoli TaxID=528178 RepID=UPI0011A1073A|nr:type II toxin-antitoxin system VapC family toxin [Neorhizobium alkalisoli]
MFLLDTNVVSAARRVHRQEAGFQAFMQKFRTADAYLSAITIMEIRFGIQGAFSKDAKFAADLDRWLNEDLLIDFAGRILPFDAAIALRTGMLPTPGRRPTSDAMIAATALQHGLTMVTRNLADFSPFSVSCLDPWNFKG